MRMTTIVAVLIGFFIVPALAQTKPTSTPVRVRGTVEGVVQGIKERRVLRVPRLGPIEDDAGDSALGRPI